MMKPVCVRSAVTTLFLGIAACPAFAEYTLQPGDVLEFTVMGYEGLQKQITIDTDGRVFLPVIGDVTAGGKTLSALREDVIYRFSEATYRVVGPNTGELLHTFTPGSVLIDVAEYRPIFVLGDVERAGELAFRPGMTVLQALAGAGGMQLVSSDAEGSELFAIRLQAEAKVLRVQIRQREQTIARLRTDLENLMLAAGPDGEGSASGLSSDSWTDARQKARQLRHEQTTATIAQLERRLKILREQEEAALESVRLDTEQVENLEGLSENSYVAAQTREAQQSLLLSTSRALDIGADRGSLEVEILRLSLSDGVEDEVETARILELIENQDADLSVAREELRGTLSQLTQIGYAAPETQVTSEIVVVRDVAEGSTEISATPSMKLEPGDVVQVTISILSEESDPSALGN